MEEIIGLTYGRYDVLTPKDLDNLEHYKTLCDKLILALEPNTHNTFEERKKLVKLVSCVDEVLLFENSTTFLKSNKIDLLFLKSCELLKDSNFDIPIYYF